MFERIVCPIDFSESSVRTLQWAEFFSKEPQVSAYIPAYRKSVKVSGIDR